MTSVWKRSIGWNAVGILEFQELCRSVVNAPNLAKAPRLWWMLGSSSWLLWPSLLTVQCWCATWSHVYIVSEKATLAFGVLLRIGRRVWHSKRQSEVGLVDMVCTDDLHEVLLLQKLPRLLTRQADIQASYDKLWWQRVLSLAVVDIYVGRLVDPD